jgi:hypothetical protein
MGSVQREQIASEKKCNEQDRPSSAEFEDDWSSNTNSKSGQISSGIFGNDNASATRKKVGYPKYKFSFAIDYLHQHNAKGTVAVDADTNRWVALG